MVERYPVAVFIVHQVVGAQYFVPVFNKGSKLIRVQNIEPLDLSAG